MLINPATDVTTDTAFWTPDLSTVVVAVLIVTGVFNGVTIEVFTHNTLTRIPSGRSYSLSDGSFVTGNILFRYDRISVLTFTIPVISAY